MINQAIVLAAGKGIRLRPLTESIPKVMVEVRGKPVIEYIIEKLRKNGINDITLVVNYKKEELRNYFKNSVKYIEQEKPLGTANAVHVAKEFIKGDFLVVYGDIFFTDDLSDFVKNEPTLMAVCKVEDTSRFGRVEIEDDRIVNITEKDGIRRPGTINAGIFLFNKKIFDAIEETKISSRGEYELTDSIKILIKKGNIVRPYFLKGRYWKDIGSVSDLEEVRRF